MIRSVDHMEEAGVEPRVHRWTREEYYAMGEAGVFDLEEGKQRRVELIDGTIVDMTPQKNTHMVAIGLAQAAVTGVFGPTVWVRVQGPMRMSDASEPEPDIAIVPGSPRDYNDHPATALLVIEVSDSTLAFDRGRKAGLYAGAGVEDYWVVNLVDRVVEVYRSPTPDAAADFGYRYADRHVLHPGESTDVLAKPGVSVRVDDLLP